MDNSDAAGAAAEPGIAEGGRTTTYIDAVVVNTTTQDPIEELGTPSKPTVSSTLLEPPARKPKLLDEPPHRTLCEILATEASTFVELAGFADPKRLFPITKWARYYNSQKFIGDLIAGVTVGIMLLPQGMAYSTVAGLPPIYGLYGAYMGLIVYCFTGTSKDITTGPTALMSLIVSHAFAPLEKPNFDNPCSDVVDEGFCCQDGDDYLCTPVNLAIGLSFVTGIYQIAMGFMNLGWVIDFIGFPVLNGFTTAAAITIFTSQIKFVLGLSEIRRDFTEALEDIVNKIEDTRWQDVVMGLTCIVITYWLEGVSKKYKPRKDHSRLDYFKWLCGTARNSLVIVLAIIVARIVAVFEDDKVFSLIRDVPRGVGTPGFPLKDIPSSDMGDVWIQSTVTALLGFLESIAIGKAFAQKDGYDLDPTQELRALGLGNFVNSFFQGYPITGSFSRTAVNNASNVQTPLAGLVTGGIVIISLYALTPVFFYIPKASLGAIIMMSVVHMVSVEEVKRIARVNPADLVVWLTSFLACLFWSLEFGILLACGVSVLIMAGAIRSQTMFRMNRDNEYAAWVPNLAYETKGLARNWGPRFVFGCTEDFICIKLNGNLQYLAATLFKDRVATIARYFLSEDQVRSVIFDMSSVTRIDYTGVQALEYALKEMRPGIRKVEEFDANGKHIQTKKMMKGIRVHLAALQGPTLRSLKQAKIFGGDLQLGDWKARQHASIDLAVQSLKTEHAQVESDYPFPWMAPSSHAFYEDLHANAIGEDDQTWVIRMKGKTKMWTRLKLELGQAIFKQTEC